MQAKFCWEGFGATMDFGWKVCWKSMFSLQKQVVSSCPTSSDVFGFRLGACHLARVTLVLDHQVHNERH